MFRTQISLGEEERRALDDETRRSGRSMSALIREAVRRTYGAPSISEADRAAMRSAFGAWADRPQGDDGAAYVDAHRSRHRQGGSAE